MASLAQRRQVQKVGHLRPFVEDVGDGQNDNAAGVRMGFVVDGAAPFTPAGRAVLEDEPAPEAQSAG